MKGGNHPANAIYRAKSETYILGTVLAMPLSNHSFYVVKKELKYKEVKYMGLFGMTLRFGVTGLSRQEQDTETGIEAGEKEVELPGHDSLKIAQSLNFMGDTCLRTNLVTKKVLAYSRDGDVIVVITDNPSSAETIPFMLPDYDCVHLATIHEVECWRIYIGKGIARFKHFSHAL